MVIKLGANAQPKPAETNLESLGSTPPAGEQQTPAPTQPPNPPSNQPTMTAPGHQSQASYLISGQAQRSQIEQVKAVQEMRTKLRGGAREFWLNPGEFAKLYFLDGTLKDDLTFDTPMIVTHKINIGGELVQLVCNKNVEGDCIICNSNADMTQPATLQLFTVINVMPYVIKKGPNKGKTLPARLQLFAATMKTRQKLIKRAQNHGNTLAGSIYSFSREAKQDARTGDDIEYIQDVPMQAVLQKYPMLSQVYDATAKEWKEAPTQVYDYAKVYPVLTNAEIAGMRPDMAQLAGWTGVSHSQPNTGFGSDPTGAIDDQVPF